MKILAIKSRRLGDTILWTSALQALRAYDPEGELDIAYPGAYRELFEVAPYVSNQYRLSKGQGTNLSLRSRLRARHYDWVLAFHASHRTLLLSLLAGAKGKIIHHHSRSQRRFFSDRPVQSLGQPMPALERDLNVVRTLGWQGPAPPTKIYTPASWEQKAREQLTGKGWKQEKPLILLGVGASRPAKRWPLERYLALSKQLSREYQIGVVYENEGSLSDYFMEQVIQQAWLLPTPKLSNLIGYLTQASVYVGSDSGVKHLACALDVPTVTLFGPESVAEWHGYGSKHPVLRQRVLCRTEDPNPPDYSWCGEEVCPYGSHSCMNLTTPEDVIREVKGLI